MKAKKAKFELLCFAIWPHGYRWLRTDYELPVVFGLVVNFGNWKKLHLNFPLKSLTGNLKQMTGSDCSTVSVNRFCFFSPNLHFQVKASPSQSNFSHFSVIQLTALTVFQSKLTTVQLTATYTHGQTSVWAIVHLWLTFFKGVMTLSIL